MVRCVGWTPLSCPSPHGVTWGDLCAFIQLGAQLRLVYPTGLHKHIWHLSWGSWNGCGLTGLLSFHVVSQHSVVEPECLSVTSRRQKGENRSCKSPKVWPQESQKITSTSFWSQKAIANGLQEMGNQTPPLDGESASHRKGWEELFVDIFTNNPLHSAIHFFHPLQIIKFRSISLKDVDHKMRDLVVHVFIRSNNKDQESMCQALGTLTTPNSDSPTQ